MAASNNHLKTPFSQAMTDAISRMIQDAVQKSGKALPVVVKSRDGAFVTVSFQIDSQWTLPQIKVPILSSQYVRLPISVGDVGVVVPFDARLTNITGQGGNVPKTDQPGNLSALAFVPIGSLQWPNVGPDGDLILYAVAAGAVLTMTGVGMTLSGPVADFRATGQVRGATLKADNGATGTFTSQDGKTITVTAGIITNIV